MTSRQITLIAIVCALVAIFAGYKIFSTKPPQSLPAATVASPVHEEQLNTIVLSEEAEKRLGIQLSSVEVKTLPRTRLYSGEIAVPAGQSVIVAAPMGGILQAPPEGMPKPGQQVKKDQVIFLLSPTLTAEARTTLATSRIDADGQLKNAQSQEKAAKIALGRAQRLFRDQVGSRRGVDEAQATYDIAMKSLQAARERKTILDKAVGAGALAPVPVTVPQSGILRNITSLPGQNVTANAPLFELANVADIWVKVSLPVGDMDDIERNSPAQIGSLSAKSKHQLQLAYPVTAPPSANPLLGTVDIFYSMTGDINLAPGQRVGVTLPLYTVENSLVIPSSAIVFDIYGSSWVYELSASYTYKRHRVDLGATSGNQVTVINGLNKGMKLVSIGAQEIFGAETGFSK